MLASVKSFSAAPFISVMMPPDALKAWSLVPALTLVNTIVENTGKTDEMPSTIHSAVAPIEEKAKALEAGWAEVVARSFIGPDSSTATRKEELTEQLLKVARGNLDQSQIGAFQEAIAKGLYPAADDKEEAKSKIPDCCSLQSTTKS